MADDDKVTDISDKSNGKKKTGSQILNEIKGELIGKKAKETKTKLLAKLEEKDKLETSLKLVEAEIDKIITEYEASTK